MKHAKRPTRKQKMLMKSALYNCEVWLVIKETAEEMIVRSKYADKKNKETRTIRKELYK